MGLKKIKKLLLLLLVTSQLPSASKVRFKIQWSRQWMSQNPKRPNPTLPWDDSGIRRVGWRPHVQLRDSGSQGFRDSGIQGPGIYTRHLQ